MANGVEFPILYFILYFGGRRTAHLTAPARRRNGRLPSEDVAGHMAAINSGACSAQRILDWHGIHPPQWERKDGDTRPVARRAGR